MPMKVQAASPEMSPLSREEEQAEVIRRLEEDIIFGRFAPGSRLVEDTLMSRYGASRHFVRQALFQLERQGIVLREKNIGATVRFYSGDEVRQIYEVREMLTRQAALMIALPASAALIDQLTELQRQYCAKADAQDLRGIHEANDAFHVALFSACGNPYLVRSLQDYMNLTLPMRAKNLADTEGLALSRRQHEFIIGLLKGRDSWALAQLCVDHMQFSKSDYLGRIGAGESNDLHPSFRDGPKDQTGNLEVRVANDIEIPRCAIAHLRFVLRTPRNDGESHFQSMILLTSPSNSMPQNAPPW